MHKSDIAAQLGFELHTAARLLKRNFNRRAKSHGLTRARWQVLWILRKDQGMKQAELAERMDVAPITLTRQIDLLEAEELVERRPDPQDRRCFRIYLTAAAMPVLETLHGLGIVAAGAVAAWCIWGGGGSVHTDNAYVKADKLSLALEVSGIVAEVPINANQHVNKGDLLVQLDDTSFRQLFLWSVGGFTVTSMLCGQAGSLNEMILWRLLQGVFGASLVPLSQATLLDTFPMLVGKLMQRFDARALILLGMGLISLSLCQTATKLNSVLT